MNEWKVFETETMLIVARSEEEVLWYLENELFGDREEAVNETEDIKERDINSTMSLVLVEREEIEEADYLEYEVSTNKGRPVITAPYSTFVKDMVAAGNAPGMLACWEY